ncbi:triose-phosphate transporter family-domain-containing protein [Gymnopilus junonius]|uniref:Triose-phosphate transporter family-domain-containing protein n=1 Tax=Gymnopilus junonius TaxID=109634 RepID=A0A9P5TNR0_GYMJU|nr:triose-phosphate transporter family-domain-containing protein [Gymnopilus junonius]
MTYHDCAPVLEDEKDTTVKIPANAPPVELPSPVIAQQQKATPTAAKYKLSSTVIIPIWIVLSSTVIIYNNYLYNTLNFKYPVFLVTWHLTFAAIGTRILQRTTTLVDGVKDVHMTKDLFVRSILPIGLLFSGSLILSNTAYLYLSVSYIQMLKAFVPVAILLISWTFRVQEPNKKLAVIVFMISTGVALASQGELHFNLLGFLTQAAAVAFYDSNSPPQYEMDPLVSLHYYAPICAVINMFFLPLTEGLEPFYELKKLGVLVMLSNASVAFLLNVAAVFLVGVGSGLVLTLAGVFKDILLITGSVLIFGSQITPLQIFGYSIALGGLVLFKTSGGK